MFGQVTLFQTYSTAHAKQANSAIRGVWRHRVYAESTRHRPSGRQVAAFVRRVTPHLDSAKRETPRHDAEEIGDMTPSRSANNVMNYNLSWIETAGDSEFCIIMFIKCRVTVTFRKKPTT